MTDQLEEKGNEHSSRVRLEKKLADLEKQLSEERARLEELRQVNRELDALTRVTDNAISTLDIHELVDSLLERLRDIIGADAGTILLREGERLAISASIGVGREDMPGFAAQASDDFSRIIMATDKPLYIEDAQRDPRIASPFVRERGVRTMLGVPLKYRGNVIGALFLLWFEVHGENLRDVRLLEVTADRCAMAINNALLFGQVRRARDELEQKVRERTAELSDVVRDLHLEAEVRDKTEKELKRARREVAFFFDLMGRDIGAKDQAALSALAKVVSRIGPEGLGKDNEQLLAEAIEDIEGSVQITRNIGILRAASAERQSLKVVDLDTTLREVIDRFATVPDRKITIRYAPSPLCKKFGCNVTATDLHREAYANIIHNSIERSTGALTINISLSHYIEGKEQYCRVTIEDDGPGIPDDLKHYIFELGEMEIAKLHIEGLGLYVARMLVESAGGTIYIEDRVPGDHAKGTRFIVTIPAKYHVPGLVP